MYLRLIYTILSLYTMSKSKTTPISYSNLMDSEMRVSNGKRKRSPKPKSSQKALERELRGMRSHTQATQDRDLINRIQKKIAKAAAKDQKTKREKARKKAINAKKRG